MTICQNLPRAKMLSLIKHLVQAILGQFGFRLVRYQAAPLEQFFGMLKNQGFAPGYIIDVGANKGNWTRSAIQYWPQAKYTLIEPQGELKSHVGDLLESSDCQIEWITAGAADKTGELNFTVSKNSVSSTFVLSQEDAKALGLDHKQVQIITLNDLVASHGGQIPEMVKIDAEGFDLKVLEGASGLLGKTDIFLLEAAILANVENTLEVIIEKMSTVGYRLIDITDINRSSKHDALWLVEAAFLKKTSQLLESIDSYE